MQTRTIGNKTVGEVQVGAIGLGLMTFDQSGAQPRQQLLDSVRQRWMPASHCSTPRTPTVPVRNSGQMHKVPTKR